MCSVCPVTVTSAVNSSVGRSEALMSNHTFLPRPEKISWTTKNRPWVAAMGAACSLAKGTAPSSSAAAQRCRTAAWAEFRTQASTASASRSTGTSSVE